MSTLRPFILSSLALHLLGVGILLFWVFSPPARSTEEVKVLTVMLVSDDYLKGGAPGAEGAFRQPRDRTIEAGLKTINELPPPKGKKQLNQGQLASAPDLNSRAGSGTGPAARDQKVALSPKRDAGTFDASKGDGSVNNGIPGGRGNSPGTGESKVSSLPGNGRGQGWGTSEGNGWGHGIDERLYLKGGYQITPAYPPSARRQGHEGTTYLKIKVSPEGKVLEVLIDQSSGHQDLDEAAVAAVKSWRFEPPTRGEQKVSLWARVPIKFQLRNR